MSHVVSAVRTTSPREYFRAHLFRHTSTVADLVWYLDQAVPRFAGSAEVRLAVEELVDRVGVLLGFDVSRGEDDGYGIWTSPAGAHLIVWAVDGTGAVTSVGAGAHTRDRLLASIAVPTDDLLTCLYVVCGAVNEKLLNEAVALRRATRQVRLISVDALVALGGRLENGAVTHDDAVTLLRPASALADAAVAMTAGRPLGNPN